MRQMLEELATTLPPAILPRAGEENYANRANKTV